MEPFDATAIPQVRDDVAHSDLTQSEFVAMMQRDGFTWKKLSSKVSEPVTLANYVIGEEQTWYSVSNAVGPQSATSRSYLQCLLAAKDIILKGVYRDIRPGASEEQYVAIPVEIPYTQKQNVRSAEGLQADREVQDQMVAHRVGAHDGRWRGRVSRCVRPGLGLAIEDGDPDQRKVDGDADPVDGNALEVMQDDDEWPAEH